VKILGNFKTPVYLIFFTLTLILLVVSLVVHALLYAGVNTRDNFPVLWRCLQYAIFIGFIPKAVSYLTTRLGTSSSPPPYVWGSARYEEYSSLETYLETAIGVTIVFLCGYALLNPTYWYVERLHQWNPYAVDGHYFASFKVAGNKIRSLTAEEYRVMSLYFARAGSSHWIACHLIALVLLFGDWKAASKKALQMTAR